MVAIGAAVYANAIVTGSSAYNPDIPASTARGGSGSLPVVVPDIIQDVNSHGLGIITHDEDGIGHNSIIIPRNQPIPVMMDQDYVTMVDGQTCTIKFYLATTDTGTYYWWNITLFCWIDWSTPSIKCNGNNPFNIW